jgi:hypothetical protein
VHAVPEPRADGGVRGFRPAGIGVGVAQLFQCRVYAFRRAVDRGVADERPEMRREDHRQARRHRLDNRPAEGFQQVGVVVVDEDVDGAQERGRVHGAVVKTSAWLRIPAPLLPCYCSMGQFPGGIMDLFLRGSD